MKAGDVITILSACPDADVLIWNGHDKEEIEITVSVKDDLMEFCFNEA